MPGLASSDGSVPVVISTVDGNGKYSSASDYIRAMKIRTITTANQYSGRQNIQLASRVLLPPTQTQQVHNTFAVHGVRMKVRGRG